MAYGFVFDKIDYVAPIKLNHEHMWSFLASVTNDSLKSGFNGIGKRRPQHIKYHLCVMQRLVSV